MTHGPATVNIQDNKLCFLSPSYFCCSLWPRSSAAEKPSPDIKASYYSRCLSAGDLALCLCDLQKNMENNGERGMMGMMHKYGSTDV